MSEKRKKQCYWHIPYSIEYVRLEPEGDPLKTHVDEEDGTVYVIDPEDGERSYLVLG